MTSPTARTQRPEPVLALPVVVAAGRP